MPRRLGWEVKAGIDTKTIEGRLSEIVAKQRDAVKELIKNSSQKVATEEKKDKK